MKWYNQCKGKGKGVPIFGVPKNKSDVIPCIIRNYKLDGVFDSRWQNSKSEDCKLRGEKMGATVAATSVEGKSIQAKQDERGKFELLIDGSVHQCKNINLFKLKADKPVVDLDFPFSSGSKKIEVFGKNGLMGVGVKMKLCIDGKYADGDNF